MWDRSCAVYLQQAGLGGDDEYVRVAVVLGNRQQLFGGRGWPELEGRAGSPDIPRVRDVAELVKLPIRFRDIVT